MCEILNATHDKVRTDPEIVVIGFFGKIAVGIVGLMMFVNVFIGCRLLIKERKRQEMRNIRRRLRDNTVIEISEITSQLIDDDLCEAIPLNYE